jgi:pimeloyl-ACP methyl ester carboxylesterase
MGHSRGATASLLLAGKRPDLIRALVLIDPTILPNKKKSNFLIKLRGM